MNANSAENLQENNKVCPPVSPEFKSFEFELTSPNLISSESLPLSSPKVDAFPDSFLFRMLKKCTKSDIFLPVSNKDPNEFPKTTKCKPFFLLSLFIGLSLMMFSMTYISDLKQNSDNFFGFFSLGSGLIILSLPILKGYAGLLIFSLKNNVFSIFFAFALNCLLLNFFAARAKSTMFSLVFVISQVMLILYLLNNCLGFDFGMQARDVFQRCLAFLKKRFDRKSNDKFIMV